MAEQVLELRHITKGFGAKLVLDGINLTINRTDRIGLVGENGTGKTTLAKIIMGALAADTGSVLITPGVQIGYLAQEADGDESITVQHHLERAIGSLERLRDEMATLEQTMAAPHLAPDHMAAVMERYGVLQEQFTQQGGYEVDYRIDQVLTGLDLTHVERQRTVWSLSGGEKTRLMLAGLLLRSPSLLILDEPTNHLDVGALTWLEGYLTHYTGAVLAISHDRRFLNRVVTHIAELSPFSHTLTLYHGNYDAYAAERDRLREQHEIAFAQQQAEIKALQRQIKMTHHNTGSGRAPTDNDKFAKAFFAGRVDVQQRRDIRQAKRKLETLLENPLERPVAGWSINPDFQPEDLISRTVIRLDGLSKRYESRLLLDDITATVAGGERIVLQGPNGIGKTTLIKIILGLVQPDRGTVRLAAGAHIGYLDQEQETLDPTQTVLASFRRDLIGTEADHRANLHKYGLFTAAEVTLPVGNLSVGQRRKLQIARMIATRANVLILDEPTNHLDLESVERFEQALCEFPGTVLAISHDRTFAEQVATTLWTLEAGQLHIERRVE